MQIQKVLSNIKNIDEEIQNSLNYLLMMRLKKSTNILKDTSQFKKFRTYVAKLKTFKNLKKGN